MGSLGGRDNDSGNDKVYVNGEYDPNNVTFNLHDLSFREIEVIVGKLEQDNINLRRELHESKVTLNEKDEEILKLGRELLTKKKEVLLTTQRVFALAEDFKKGQVDGLYNFLLKMFACNGVVTNGQQSSVNNCFSGPSLSHGKLVTIAGSASVEPPKLAEICKVSGVDEDEATTATCSEDDEQHVRAPLTYQYRHLRMQHHSDDSMK